jgi:flagellum-specific ATP synthase
VGAPIDLGVRVLNTFITSRTGTRSGEGTITGVFTVLLEGDDHNEPIADAVRAVLDGHIVMERAIAERGRYPSINVLKSVSRSMPRSTAPAYLEVLARARKVMATYSDMEELIRLGAYRPGSSPEVTKPSGSTRRLRPFWPRTRPNPRA